MRSRNCKPRLVYFLAILTTNLRLASASSRLASLSLARPSLIASNMSTSSLSETPASSSMRRILRRTFLSFFSYSSSFVREVQHFLGRQWVLDDGHDDLILGFLDPFGDFHLSLASQQRNRPHLAQVHTHRIICMPAPTLAQTE